MKSVCKLKIATLARTNFPFNALNEVSNFVNIIMYEPFNHHKYFVVSKKALWGNHAFRKRKPKKVYFARK